MFSIVDPVMTSLLLFVLDFLRQIIVTAIAIKAITPAIIAKAIFQPFDPLLFFLLYLVFSGFSSSSSSSPPSPLGELLSFS